MGWVVVVVYLLALVGLRAVSVLFVASGRASGWKEEGKRKQCVRTFC